MIKKYSISKFEGENLFSVVAEIVCIKSQLGWAVGVLLDIPFKNFTILEMADGKIRIETNRVANDKELKNIVACLEEFNFVENKTKKEGDK